MGSSSGKQVTEHVIPLTFGFFSPYAMLGDRAGRYPKLLETNRRPDGSPWMSEMEWLEFIRELRGSFRTPTTIAAERPIRRSVCIMFTSFAALVPSFFLGALMTPLACSAGDSGACSAGIVFIVVFMLAIGLMMCGAVRSFMKVAVYAELVVDEMPRAFSRITERFPFLDLDLRIASGANRYKIRIRLAQPREEALERHEGERPAPVVVGAALAAPLPDRVPTYWQNQQLQEHFLARCNIDAASFAAIEGALSATFRRVQTRDRKGSMPSGLRLMSAHRVENSRVWSRYRSGLERLRSTRATCDNNVGSACTTEPLGPMAQALEGSLNEFYLWHGTSPTGALGISEGGFRLDLSGSSTGSMFGEGAYFAECSSKADEYAQEGEGIYVGTYALLLCRVVCGQMLRLTRPNEKTLKEQLGRGAIDSVLGDREASVGTYREFVVFQDTQVYPEFVILYGRG